MANETINQKIQTALYEIARRAITADSLDDFLSFLHRVLSGLVSSENMYVALYDREKEWVTVPFSAGARRQSERPVPAPPASVRGAGRRFLSAERP